MALSASAAGQQYSRLADELERTAISFGAAASAGAVFTGSLRSFSAFEQQLINTNAVAHGTVETFKQFKQASQDFSLATTASSTQVANALYFMASAGFTAQQSIQALQGVTLLAAATLSDLSTTADVMAGALKAFGLGAEDSTRVSNVFAATVKTSQATLEKLAYAFRQVGPVAHDAGLSIEQTSAYLSQLFNVGLRGEQAGTVLRNVILRLQAPTAEASAMFRQMHIELFAANGQMNDLSQILTKLSAQNLSEGTLSQLFGLRAADGVTALLSSMKDGDFASELGKITGTNFAFAIAAQQMESFSSQVDLAKNSINLFAQSLGGGLASALTPVLRGVQSLGYWFNDLDGKQQKLVGSTLAWSLALLATGRAASGLASGAKFLAGGSLGFSALIGGSKAAQSTLADLSALGAGIGTSAAAIGVPGARQLSNFLGQRSPAEFDQSGNLIMPARYGDDALEHAKRLALLENPTRYSAYSQVTPIVPNISDPEPATRYDPVTRKRRTNAEMAEADRVALADRQRQRDEGTRFRNEGTGNISLSNTAARVEGDAAREAELTEKASGSLRRMGGSVLGGFVKASVIAAVAVEVFEIGKAIYDAMRDKGGDKDQDQITQVQRAMDDQVRMIDLLTKTASSVPDKIAQFKTLREGYLKQIDDLKSQQANAPTPQQASQGVIANKLRGAGASDDDIKAIQEYGEKTKAAEKALNDAGAEGGPGAATAYDLAIAELNKNLTAQQRALLNLISPELLALAKKAADKAETDLKTLPDLVAATISKVSDVDARLSNLGLALGNEATKAGKTADEIKRNALLFSTSLYNKLNLESDADDVEAARSAAARDPTDQVKKVILAKREGAAKVQRELDRYAEETNQNLSKKGQPGAFNNGNTFGLRDRLTGDVPAEDLAGTGALPPNAGASVRIGAAIAQPLSSGDINTAQARVKIINQKLIDALHALPEADQAGAKPLVDEQIKKNNTYLQSWSDGVDAASAKADKVLSKGEDMQGKFAAGIAKFQNDMRLAAAGEVQGTNPQQYVAAKKDDIRAQGGVDLATRIEEVNGAVRSGSLSRAQGDADIKGWTDSIQGNVDAKLKALDDATPGMILKTQNVLKLNYDKIQEAFAQTVLATDSKSLTATTQTLVSDTLALTRANINAQFDGEIAAIQQEIAEYQRELANPDSFANDPSARARVEGQVGVLSDTIGSKERARARALSKSGNENSVAGFTRQAKIIQDQNQIGDNSESGSFFQGFIAQGNLAKDQMETLFEQGGKSFTILSDGIAKSFASMIVSNNKNWKQGLADMLRSLETFLLEATIKQAALSLLGFGAKGPGAAPGGGLLGGLLGGLGAGIGSGLAGDGSRGVDTGSIQGPGQASAGGAPLEGPANTTAGIVGKGIMSQLPGYIASAAGWIGTLFANGGVMTPRGPVNLYAGGGVATGPQVAIYGEGSHHEAYVPLPDGRRIPVALNMKGGGGTTVINAPMMAAGIGSGSNVISGNAKNQHTYSPNFSIDHHYHAGSSPGDGRDNDTLSQEEFFRNSDGMNKLLDTRIKMSVHDVIQEQQRAGGQLNSALDIS